MKYCLLLILLFFIVAHSVVAQPGRAIRVKAGEDVAQAYSPHGFYRFPEFNKAILYFNGNRRKSDILFNFNLYSGSMQFINPKGDTLDLVNTPAPDSVVFEKNSFIYNNGFLEVVAQSDSLRLLKKLVLKTQGENIGAYGQPNPTGSITSVAKISIGAAVYSLIVNQDVVLTEDINWFFMPGKNVAVKATKANLLKLLPVEKQAKAEAYFKQNKVSFDRENDLKNLLEAIRS